MSIIVLIMFMGMVISNGVGMSIGSMVSFSMGMGLNMG